MIETLRRHIPKPIKGWIKSFLNGIGLEVSKKKRVTRPCVDTWPKEFCKCDLFCNAAEQKSMRERLLEVLGRYGIECVTNNGIDENHFSIDIKDAQRLVKSLTETNFKLEIRSKSTAINEYDFPQLSDGTNLAEVVSREHKVIRVLQPARCRQRKRDAQAFGFLITTFNDAEGVRLFHSQSVKSRTRSLPVGSSDSDNLIAIPQCPIIDIVVTTVDGSDRAWQTKMLSALAEEPDRPALNKTTNLGRFANHDELRYLLRSVYYYAPWVRTIHIVTDNQCPQWLDKTHPMINLVDHKAIIDSCFLPTFNSDAIESAIWRIPGLSEEFVYFNDDMLLMSLTTKKTFFSEYGVPYFFESPRRLPSIPAEWASAYTSNAHIRTADILEEHGYPRPRRKFKHIPYAGKKSIFEQIEKEFRDELVETRRSKFRSIDSMATFSFLYENFALATMQGQLSDLPYKYIEITDGSWKEQLYKVCKDTETKIVCINDSSIEPDEGELSRDLKAILSARFPKVPPWEI